MASQSSTDERVYDAITSALLQGRLVAGAQLVERDLAAAFDCTRGTIRKVLARLGAEGKLTLEANRGAFVPSPSAEDIREVYRARQVVEAGGLRRFAGRSKRRINALYVRIFGVSNVRSRRGGWTNVCGVRGSFIFCSRSWRARRMCSRFFLRWSRRLSFIRRCLILLKLLTALPMNIGFGSMHSRLGILSLRLRACGRI